MKLFCKWFGHSWSVYTTPDNKKFRHCSCCNALEEWRTDVPHYGNNWYRLVQYAPKGAADLMAEKEKLKEN